MLLELGRDRHRLAREQGRDPIGRPGALAGVVNASERLQSDGLGDIVRQRAAEVMPVAAHRKRRRADRTAEVEGEDLRSGIAAELHRHQRQQHALSRVRRSDDQGMADIADVKRKPERRRAFRLCEERRRALEMLVPFRPGPPRTASYGRDSRSRSAAAGRWRRHGRAGCRARPRSRSRSRACR